MTATYSLRTVESRASQTGADPMRTLNHLDYPLETRHTVMSSQLDTLYDY